MKKLLVIVDMNNGFTREGVFKNPYQEALIPGINKLALEYENNNHEIVMINERHDVDSKEFNTFPPHCIKGTSEAEIVDELKWIEEIAPTYHKNSTNGMLIEEMIDYLHEHEDLDEVVITGGVTDICVLEMALTMKKYFDHFNLNTNVIVAEDLVDTYDAEWHDREKYNELAFVLMNQAGIEIKPIYEKNKVFVKQYTKGV